MFRHILVLLVIVTASGVAYAQEEKALPRIAVAEFADRTGEAEMAWVACGLRAELTRRLMTVSGLVVTDTPTFTRSRNELGLMNKDLSDPAEAVKVGRALGTNKVLIGHYVQAPTGVKVAVRLLDTSSGKIEGSELSRAGSPISVAAGLALDVAKELNAKVDNTDAITKNLTSNSDAYESYCKGLQYKNSEETYEKAIEHFIKATERDKEYAAPHFELGWLFTMTGPAMYRSAVKEYKKAISLYPEYAQAYNNMGVIHMRLEQPQSARSAFLRAIKLVPNYVDAHFNLGRLYDTLGQYDKAIKEYKETLALNPSDGIAHNNLAVALLNKGENDEAQEHYSAALKLVPDLKEAHLGLGLIFDSKGDTERAIRHYQKFFDLGGYDEDISERLEQLKSKKE